MDVVSVGIIGLAAAFLAVQLKSFRAEYAAYVIFGAGVVIAFYTVGKLEAVTGLFNRFLEELPVDAVYIVLSISLPMVLALLDTVRSFLYEGL